jgi:hypothetical protein
VGRARAWIATVTAALGIGLSLRTIMAPDWIEEFLHVEPDAGSGDAEWLIAGGLLAMSAVLVGWAALEWRHVRSFDANR